MFLKIKWIVMFVLKCFKCGYIAQADACASELFLIMKDGRMNLAPMWGLPLIQIMKKQKTD